MTDMNEQNKKNISMTNGDAFKVSGHRKRTIRAPEKKFVTTVDKEALGGITSARSLEKIREELKIGQNEFDEERKASVVWAAEPGNRKVGVAVLVSFYDEMLSECTGQLAFRAQHGNDKLATGFSLTHWPTTTSTLRRRFVYVPKNSHKEGHPPVVCTVKGLIDKYVEAFNVCSKKSDETGTPFNIMWLCNRFVDLLSLERSDKALLAIRRLERENWRFPYAEMADINEENKKDISNTNGDGFKELEMEFVCTVDKKALEEIMIAQSLERIREELNMDKVEFYKERRASFVQSGNRKVGVVVLVSFYDETLSECTGQLALRAQCGENKLVTGFSLTHWPKTTSPPMPCFVLRPKNSHEEGHPSVVCTVNGLIDKYVEAFNVFSEKRDKKGKPFNETWLCNKFADLLSLDHKKPAGSFIEHAIETDDEETNVHVFTYKRRLAVFADNTNPVANTIGSVSVFMHWGVVFKFEKLNGDVYWTLDGGRLENTAGKLSLGKFVVRAHRGPPSDIEEYEKKSEKCDRMLPEPRVKYHCFVRSSRRRVMLAAKNLKFNKFRGNYNLLNKNCQKWTDCLLREITGTHDHFWYGPKTLESRYYDSFGRKKVPPTWESNTTSPQVPSDRLHQRVDVVIKGESSTRLSSRDFSSYEEMLRAMMRGFGMTEDAFKKRRHVKMYKLDAQESSVLVKFSRSRQEEIEVCYEIRTLCDNDPERLLRVRIVRFEKGPGEKLGLNGQSDAKSWLSARALFKWCLMLQQWLAVSDEKEGRKYSNERLVDKLIESQKVIPTSFSIASLNRKAVNVK